MTVPENYNVSKNNIGTFVNNPLHIQLQKIDITLNQLKNFVEEKSSLPLSEEDTINLEIVKQSIILTEHHKETLLKLNEKLAKMKKNQTKKSNSRLPSGRRVSKKSRSSSRAAEEVSSSKSKSKSSLKKTLGKLFKSTKGGKKNKTQKKKRI